jgi:hypothetical protein
MKLIKSVLMWQILGVAVLYGMAQLVDEGFARHFAREVLLVCLGIGLVRGGLAIRRKRREKRDVNAALEGEASSAGQRGTWATESKKRAAEAVRICGDNNRLSGNCNPMFTAKYDADNSMEQIMDALEESTETQVMLMRYSQNTRREGESE